MSSVLLVEDDEKIQRIYEFAFQSAGFETELAPNGAEALVRIDERKNNNFKPFDMILLDMMMLGMSGLDFLQNFKRNEYPETKIMALTNIDNPNVEAKARALGVEDYLNKANFDPGQIVARVNSLIGAK
jgi:two-component system, OmpR family, alkaline phosphatase synthesis response regulator PhoP